MKTIISNLLVLVFLAGMGGVALADSPPSLAVTDSHSIMAKKGKINLYRTQIQDLEFGRGKEVLDAEVLVTLDSMSDMVFGVRLHEDSPPMNTVMAATLREAFLANIPVTIYYQIAPGRKIVKIHIVQLEH